MDPNLLVEIDGLKSQVKGFHETFDTAMDNFVTSMKMQNAVYNAKLDEKDACIAFLTAERAALQEDVKKLRAELTKKQNKKPLVMRILRL